MDAKGLNIATSNQNERVRLSHFTVEKAPDMVFWVDSEARIVRVNETVATETGFSIEELESMRAYEINSAYERRDWPSIWAKIKTAGSYTLETELITQKGSSIPVEVKHNYIQFEGHEYTVSFARNISERKKSEARLRHALGKVEKLKERLKAENVYLQEEILLNHNFREIVSQSNVMQDVLEKVEIVGPTDATVLILGETGVGKDLIARALHNAGSRSERPLIKVDCTSLPANLIESELYGHEKGAFTGAEKRREGRLALADRGTIFLDEIGDLPLNQQGKLLRFLQDGSYDRLGGEQPVKVDVRVLAATNRNLQEDVKEGRFREDLFYRLNVFPINCPPLRDRKEDIPLLAHHFTAKFARKLGKKISEIDSSTLKVLSDYHWPGNVRELENRIERAVILSRDSALRLTDMPEAPITERSHDKLPTLDEIQRRHILDALRRTDWRVSGPKGAANLLGIHPQTLFARMRKLDIKRPT